MIGHGKILQEMEVKEMPTYTYHCRSCDQDFEIKQNFKDDPLSDCVLCQAHDSVYRVIQPTGVVFKGSGWYINDHKSSSSSTLASKSRPSTSGDGENGTPADKPSDKPSSTPNSTPTTGPTAAAD